MTVKERLGRWWSWPIVRAIGILLLLTAAGCAGYMLVEGWSFGDALFMSVLILSTVGLGQPHPLSAGGRAFTIGLIITSVTTAGYLVSILGQYVAGGVLTGAFRARRLQRTIDRLSGHYIVCGHGRVGRQVVADLRRRGHDVVVVEATTGDAAEDSAALPVLVGDATDDIVLARAGIARARGVVVATGSDATNLVVTLSARALNDGLIVVARASGPASEAKLLHAGATFAVSPYAIGGHRIASELMSPGVTAFLDTVMRAEHLDLWLQEVRVGARSVLVGRPLSVALPRTTGGVALLARRRRGDKEFMTNPPPETRLTVGDTLIAVGPRHSLRQLAVHAAGKSTGPAPLGNRPDKPELGGTHVTANG
jgi:voltage-gated potassium channel